MCFQATLPLSALRHLTCMHAFTLDTLETALESWQARVWDLQLHHGLIMHALNTFQTHLSLPSLFK